MEYNLGHPPQGPRNVGNRYNRRFGLEFTQDAIDSELHPLALPLEKISEIKYLSQRNIGFSRVRKNNPPQGFLNN